MTRARRLAFLATAALVTAAGCGADARAPGVVQRGSPSALDTRGPAAGRIEDVWWVMFGLAAAVYLVVGGFIVVAALRKGTADGEERPSRITDRAFIWVGGVIVPTLILLVLAVLTVRTTDVLARPAPDPLRVEVTGVRWWWAVRYPDAGVVTANEVRVPAGRPVEVTLLSDDVIHSFWVPQLAGKVDMVPGQRNVIRFRADRPGQYRGQCAEYCGIQHAKMAFLVIAEPAADFERWITRQQRLPGPPNSERAARGEVVFTTSSCAGCHTVRGTDAGGTAGPDLSDLGSRLTIGAVSAPNTRENLVSWIADSQSIKPGNLMPSIHLSRDDVVALAEYLESRR